MRQQYSDVMAEYLVKKQIAEFLKNTRRPGGPHAMSDAQPMHHS
jgi:hypothetical protein